MGSSTNKGNISTAMAAIAFSAMVLIIGIMAELMVSHSARAGKYVNPNVASQVVRGTIYDRNGRALAMEVPQNNLYIKTQSENLDIVAQVLSLYLDVTPDVILAKASKSDSEWTLIRTDLDSQSISDIKSAAAKSNLTDDVIIQKDYSRTFPAAFHAAQLIEETEKAFDSVLSPAPGFDETTTYGNNVYLTMDLDIQYLLDLAVQQVYEVQQPEYCVAFILNLSNGQMLASTTYPFYDLNDSSNISNSQKVNRTYVSSIYRPDIRVSDISVISKVTNYNSTAEITDYTESEGFTKDLEIISAMVNNNASENSLLEKIPAENPKYAVFMGSVGAKYYVGSSVLEYAISSVEEGLEAQNKI